jgi:hypothetical protein
MLVAATLSMGLMLGPAVRVAIAEAPDVKLDCSIYETKTMNFGIAFKVAQFIFNIGPEFSFSRKTGVAWDKVVHGTIARYVELCNRYNAGLVNKAEYEVRLKEIEALYKETKEMEAKLYTATRERARDAGDELDATLGRTPRPSVTNKNLESSVEKLADRVEHLEPIGQPLKPSSPCPAPDMLGAPGAIQDPGRKC